MSPLGGDKRTTAKIFTQTLNMKSLTFDNKKKSLGLTAYSYSRHTLGRRAKRERTINSILRRAGTVRGGEVSYDEQEGADMADGGPNTPEVDEDYTLPTKRPRHYEDSDDSSSEEETLPNLVEKLPPRRTRGTPNYIDGSYAWETANYDSDDSNCTTDVAVHKALYDEAADGGPNTPDVDKDYNLPTDDFPCYDDSSTANTTSSEGDMSPDLIEEDISTRGNRAPKIHQAIRTAEYIMASFKDMDKCREMLRNAAIRELGGLETLLKIEFKKGGSGIYVEEAFKKPGFVNFWQIWTRPP